MNEKREAPDALVALLADERLEIVIDDGTTVNFACVDELGFQWDDEKQHYSAVVKAFDYTDDYRRLLGLMLGYGCDPPMWWSVEHVRWKHTIYHGLPMTSVEQIVRERYERFYENRKESVRLRFATTDGTMDTLHYELDGMKTSLPLHFEDPRFRWKFREEYELQGNTSGTIPPSPDLRVAVSIPLTDIIGTRSTVTIGLLRQIGDPELKPNHLYALHDPFVTGENINGVVFEGTLTRA